MKGKRGSPEDLADVLRRLDRAERQIVDLRARLTAIESIRISVDDSRGPYDLSLVMRRMYR